MRTILLLFRNLPSSDPEPGALASEASRSAAVTEITFCPHGQSLNLTRHRAPLYESQPAGVRNLPRRGQQKDFEKTRRALLAERAGNLAFDYLFRLK